DPDRFAERYSVDDSRTLLRIDRAKSILNDVKIAPPDLDKISQVCLDLNVKGHRADISAAKVSRVLAALDGRTIVSDEDIKEAAVLCLLHRRNIIVKEKGTVPEHKDDVPENEGLAEITVSESAEEMTVCENIMEEYPQYISDESTADVGGVGTVAEIISSIKEKLEDMDNIEAIRLHRIAGTGRRKNIVANKQTGRYRGSRIPNGRSTDLAFDATVRAAAPYQRSREDKGLSISIEQQDIREKVRIKKDSCSFLFAVDVSGSLVDTGMIHDITRGVKAMLMDSYVRRDRVALLTFRTGEIRVSVPFTRYAEGICNVLENTTAGDGTPLGAALLQIREYLLNYIRKNPDERCFVILMTDGDTTDPVIRGDPVRELKMVAESIRIPNTEWVVVDSSLGTGKINHALKLSEALGARYIRLEDLQSL
ncbi:MAG: VWA domain-containing protein, partial [Candidatus Methanoplasma sp.]|nr:VWA domain-containing protein [Candidatus Methanoplasma sp.]